MRWRGRGWWELFQGEAGDAATGNVFVWDGRHVGVGDVLEAADSGGQDETFTIIVMSGRLSGLRSVPTSG